MASLIASARVVKLRYNVDTGNLTVPEINKLKQNFTAKVCRVTTGE
jgi:hypothetical protein